MRLQQCVHIAEILICFAAFSLLCRTQWPCQLESLCAKSSLGQLQLLDMMKKCNHRYHLMSPGDHVMLIAIVLFAENSGSHSQPTGWCLHLQQLQSCWQAQCHLQHGRAELLPRTIRLCAAAGIPFLSGPPGFLLTSIATAFRQAVYHTILQTYE